MVEIITCRECGKDGVPHEFVKTPKNTCKDCQYTKGMAEIEKQNYLRKKELRLRKKISMMYEKRQPKFSVYALKLTIDDRAVRLPGNILWVKCAYCGRHFIPTINSVRARISVLDGLNSGESRFYCSKGCKFACPIFNQKLYPAGFKRATSREIEPELRQIRLGLDNYECQRCGKGIEIIELHCHHITGVEQNPIESADVDNTITLCKPCHKWVHTINGCNYFELRCKKT